MKKVFSLVLAVLMVISMLPATALAANDYTINSSESTDEYYNLISKQDWEIAPGITESQIVLNNDDGSYRQVLFVMEADLNNEYVKVINSYTGMVPQYGNYKVGVMSEQAALAEEMGYGNVVGAMNTTLSWYSGYSADRVNEPLGFIMLDAEVLFDPGNCGYEYGNVGFPSVLVINKDFDEEGNPRPADIPKVEMPQIRSSADLDGWEDQVIPCSSGYILKDGVNQSSPSHTGGAPRSVVGIKPDGTVVIMVNDGRQSPYSAGMSMYELAEVMLDLGCSYAVNCDGGGTTTWVSQRPGEELKVNNSPSDGGERPTTSGILFISTAPSTNEFVRAEVTTSYDYYTPNSQVQFDALPTNLVGAEVDMPEDITWQLSDNSFGTITDDGLFTSNGKIGQVTAQIVHNGAVKGEKEISVVWPTDFAFTSDAMTIPFGKTVPIEMVATYNGTESYVALKAADITFELSDASLGTISGFSFTATSDESASVTAGTLKATIAELSDEIVVNIGKGSEVIFDFESEGSVDDWYIYDYNVNHAGGTDNSHLDLIERVTAETGKVHSGESAVAVTVDYSDARGNGWIQYRMVYQGDYFAVESAKKLGFWIWMPEEAYANELDLHIRCIDANGKAQRLAPVLTDPGDCFQKQDEAGWRYYTVDISKYPLTYFGYYPDEAVSTALFYIQFYNYQQQWQSNDAVVNTQGKFTYFIDDITIEYSDAAEDTDAPVFGTMNLVDPNGTMTEMNGQTVQYNTIGAEVSVADFAKSNATGLNVDSVKAYVDGKEVDCTYSSGRISISGVTVADGLHTVKFAACDKMGNLNSIIRQVTVKANSSIPTVNLVPHDATLTNLPSGSVYYVDLVASNIESVQNIVVDLDLVNTFTWHLDHAVVADGFKMSYTVEKYENVATITITKDGDVEATGSQVIASIPVRVWTPSIDRGLLTGALLKEVYLTIKATRGVLTCTDGTVSTFTCDPMKVATELWMNQWNAPSDFAGVTLHTHTAEAVEDEAATCTVNGYTGRTFCAVCNSVADWGTTLTATGHSYETVDGVLTCSGCDDKFTGVKDGKNYVDGVIAEGWVNDTYYYVDGVKLTGSHFLDGKMYTFDESGVYQPDYKFDGFYEIGDTVMYFIANEYVTGYQRLNSEYCYFDENGLGFDGEMVIAGTTCLFDNGVSVPTASVLDAGLCGENAYFVIRADGSMEVEGFGPMYDYTTIGLVPWNAEFRYEVKSLKIGKDITYIGERAFRGLRNLTELTFEEGSKLEEIGRIAFSYCDSLESVVLPDGLKTIKGSAFLACSKLKSVYLPSSITAISNDCMNECSSELTVSVVDGTAAYRFAVAKGIAYTLRVEEIASGECGETAWTLTSDGVLTISGVGAMADNDSGKAPWQSYANKISKIVVGKDVTYIGKFNFASLKKVTEVVFEEGSKLETIGWGAFGSCYALTEITIPASVKSLDNYAFYYCTGLKTVNFGEGSELTTIGANAFLHDAALENVFIPDKVISIGNNAFRDCLTTATFSVADGTYSHDYFAQYKVTVREPILYTIAEGTCGDTAWTLTSNGTLFISGSGAMADNDNGKAPWQAHVKLIRTIKIGKDVTYIGKFNFYNMNKATKVVFEEGSKLETIGWGAFGFCTSLTEITIPASVKTLNNYAFYHCHALETVNFAEGSELTTIGTNAFLYDTALKSVYIPDKVTSIGSNAFRDCLTTATFHVADGTYSHDYFANYKVTVREPVLYTIAEGTCGDTTWTLTSNGTLSISGSGAMADNDNGKAPWQAHVKLIRTIQIGKDVTYIGKFNFYNMNKATKVVFEEGSKLETIGWGAFGFCTSLTEITIPASVKTMNNYAFYHCHALETVSFAEGSELTTIGTNAFLYDTALKSVYIPDKVTSIGSNAFRDCLTTATFHVANGTYSHDYFAQHTVVVREPVLYTIAEGTCGDTAWTLTSDGTLSISGSGAMADNTNGQAPWQAHVKLIRTIKIGKDVTYIGKFNFYNMNKATKVVFAENGKLETIARGTFGFCTSLTEITIPASVKILDNYAFYFCTNLKTVSFAEGSALESIGDFAFKNDTALKEVNAPAGADISRHAYYGCPNMQ